MNFPTNAKVTTPLGDGISQGHYLMVDINEATNTKMVLVRLIINEKTRTELNKSNCLTPRAVLNGLWVFSENEVAL
jgi:hypothetical protein